MDGLADAVAASDGPWSLAAIALIGIYVLTWRFGAQLLAVVEESNRASKQAHLLAEKKNQAAAEAPALLAQALAEINERLDRIESGG